MTEIDISIAGISAHYEGRNDAPAVLRDVTLDIQRGELCCLVGPSGCGKTTLVRILAGLHASYTGTFQIDTQRAENGLAYIQQFDAMLPWRTVLQNAGLGAEIRGSLTPVVLSRIRDAIRDYGLHGFENHLLTELSGGMRQRVAIISALESRPSILFADEPFSAIDFVTRLELNSRFKKMCRIFGITVVFVTHNIEEAIFLGDVVAVMSGRPGHIVATFRPKFSVGGEDAVRCRESPEFPILFNSIWSALRNAE